MERKRERKRPVSLQSPAVRADSAHSASRRLGFGQAADAPRTRAAPASMGSASVPALSASPFVWAVPVQARWPPRPRTRRRCTRPCHHRPPPPAVNGRAGREGRARKRARARERESSFCFRQLYGRSPSSAPATQPPLGSLSCPAASHPPTRSEESARETHHTVSPASDPRTRRTAPASLAKLLPFPVPISRVSTPHWKVLQPRQPGDKTLQDSGEPGETSTIPFCMSPPAQQSQSRRRQNCAVCFLCRHKGASCRTRRPRSCRVRIHQRWMALLGAAAARALFSKSMYTTTQTDTT